MLCVRCGTDNPEGAKYCSNCNALMPQTAPTGNPTDHSLEIDESVKYEIPEQHYQSPLLQQLAWAIHDFTDEDGELEPILENYDAFREIYDGFRKEIPKIQDTCYSQQSYIEEDPFLPQIKYMISQAEVLYAEGEKFFESYFDLLEGLDEDEDFPDPEPLENGMRKWLSCNDNICQAFEFMVGRAQIMADMAEEMGYDPENPPVVEAEEEPVIADSTDLG